MNFGNGSNPAAKAEARVIEVGKIMDADEKAFTDPYFVRLYNMEGGLAPGVLQFNEPDIKRFLVRRPQHLFPVQDEGDLDEYWNTAFDGATIKLLKGIDRDRAKKLIDPTGHYQTSGTDHPAFTFSPVIRQRFLNSIEALTAARIEFEAHGKGKTFVEQYHFKGGVSKARREKS